MIVMWNQFLWDDHRGSPRSTITSLVVKGDNAEETAMSKTVGLPLAIGARLIANGKINLTGTHIPILQYVADNQNDAVERGESYRR